MAVKNRSPASTCPASWLAFPAWTPKATQSRPGTGNHVGLRNPFERLDELSVLLPQLRRQLMRIMSREIRDDQQMMLLLSKKTADERIATFLINLSARFSARGFSANQFRLPMSRNEIGNYLGLAVETVSRVFTRFQQNGLLEAEGKEVRITDSIGLCALAGGAMDV